MFSLCIMLMLAIVLYLFIRAMSETKAALQDLFGALLTRESWVANHDQHQSKSLQKLLGSVISMKMVSHRYSASHGGCK